MKIVHTESSQGWGGQEIRILAEAEGMRARGHEVTVIAPGGHPLYREALARGLPAADVPIARKSVRGMLKLRHWLATHPVDVINTHSSTDSWLAAIACKTLAARPAIVRTRHVSVPVPNNRSTRWLYRDAACHVVTTGEMLRRQLILENGLAPGHVTSVPTGIRPERFAPGDGAAARRATGLPQAATLIGIVATLRSWKGHRFLLEAFARLRGSDLGLVLVGDGPQRTALEAQIKALGLAARVWMPGNQSDVVPWLQALDVFALPSYANEGVPQALVQAMMVGLACVTTAVGAIPEVAMADETALIVPPQDATALAQALQRLVDDPAARQRLGGAARAHATTNFTFEAMLERMEAVFRDAVAAR